MRKVFTLILLGLSGLGLMAVPRTVMYESSTHALSAPTDFFFMSSNRLNEAVTRQLFTNVNATTVRSATGTNTGGFIFEAGITNNRGLLGSNATTAYPIPPAGRVWLFPSNDTWFQLNSAGVLTDLASGGVGGSDPTRILIENGKGTNTILANLTNKFSSVPGQPATNTMVLSGIEVGGTFYPTIGIVNQYGEYIDIVTARSDPSTAVSNILYFGANARAFAMDFKIRGVSDGNTSGPRFVRNFMKDNGVTQEAGDYFNQYAPGSVAQEVYTVDTVGGMYIWSITNNILTHGNPSYLAEFAALALTNKAPTTFTKTSTNLLGARFFGTTALTLNSPFVVNGTLVVTPFTNANPWAVNVTTNSFTRNPSATNGTIVFSGTALDGTIIYYEQLNTATTNYGITVPSSLPIQTQGNTATTGPINCTSNSVTVLRFERVSGAWQLSVFGPDDYKVTLGPNLAAAQVLAVHSVFPPILTNAAAGGATAFDVIADPSGDGSIALAGTQQTFTSTRDSAASDAIFIFSNTDADLANDTTWLRLDFFDSADANGIYLLARGNSVEDYRLSQTAFTVKSTIVTSFPTPSQGDSSTKVATTAFVASELGTSNYVTVAGSQTVTGAKTFGTTLTASSTVVHNGADTWKILTNAYNGLNVFVDMATNTLQHLVVTNSFTMIMTNQGAGQKISYDFYNTTGTNCTITLPSFQIYGSGVSNVVVAAKHMRAAFESRDAQVTNMAAAFAQQKN